MQFNINIQPLGVPPGAGFNISVQVDAPDLVTALEAAKEPIRKSAEASARALHDSLPAAPAPTPETPPA